MHKSTMLRMNHFINCYIRGTDGASVLDVGSYDVNGSYKSLLCGMNIQYTGLDICEGPNVDVVVKDIYNWTEVQDDSFDFVISGQAFEHIEYPWLSIIEIYKKLKKGGVVCIIAPSSIEEHRYPLDCYRYYGDGMAALAKWAGFEVIESVVSGIPNEVVNGEWDDRSNDTLLIAIKQPACDYQKKVIFPYKRIYNPVYDLKLENEFLKLGYEDQTIFDLFVDFVKRNQYEKVFLYGCGPIGRIIKEKLADVCIVDSIVTDKNYAADGLGIENIVLSGNYTIIDVEKLRTLATLKELVIITELDFYRTHIKYLQKEFPHKSFVYAYDVLDIEFLYKQMDINEPIYIFGAGKNGRLVYERLKGLNINIDGFVVSDESRLVSDYCGKNVSVIDEVSKDANVIVSIEQFDEMKDWLLDKKYTKVIDGRKVIKIWKYTMESVKHNG